MSHVVGEFYVVEYIDEYYHDIIFIYPRLNIWV